MNKNTDIPHSIQLLIIDYLSGNISHPKQVRLKNWINENENNLELFNRYKAVWVLSGNLQSLSISKSKDNWDTLNKRIAQGKSSVFRQKYLYQKTWSLLRVAAVFIFLFALGASLTFIFLKDDVKIPQITEIEVPMGARSHIKLPDGSQVWLNAGSTLRFNDKFNSKSERVVNLVGEAFFKVKTNHEKPFVVKANELNIMAFGTSFNVKAYPEEKEITTTLVEGIVQIKKKEFLKKDYSLKMSPNQKVVYKVEGNFNKIDSDKNSESIGSNEVSNSNAASNADNATPFMTDNNVNTELFTSWKDDRWIIKSKKLSDLIVLIERRYDVSININSPEINDYLFSGTIENETLEQVFQILRLTAPISYSIKKGGVEVALYTDLKKLYHNVYN